MLAGFLKPVIYLPDAAYSPQELELLLLHEYIHYCRRDLWYKAVFLLVNSLHWMNPTCYLLCRLAVRDCEMACDEQVLRLFGADCRLDYSSLILRSAGNRSGSALSTYFSGGKYQMKLRLSNIMSRKRRIGGLPLVILTLAAVLFTGCTVVLAQVPSTESAAPLVGESQPSAERESEIAFSIPLKEYEISSDYGYRAAVGTIHTGIDFTAPLGSEICAAMDGTVAKMVNKILATEEQVNYGHYLVVIHPDGYSTLYTHCDEIFVREGQSLKKGDIIATVGTTGNATGPVCHFEIRLNGEPIDPNDHLKLKE